MITDNESVARNENMKLIGPRRDKICLRGSDKAGLKPVSSATETSCNIEISLEASLYMILSNQRITKALIRLRECAGWSAPLLSVNPRRQVFLRRGSIVCCFIKRTYQWHCCLRYFNIASSIESNEKLLQPKCLTRIFVLF